MPGVTSEYETPISKKEVIELKIIVREVMKRVKDYKNNIQE